MSSNIFDYIKRFGDISLTEKKVNDIDMSIFSLLSYVDFNDIFVSRKKAINLGNALDFFVKYGDIKSFLKRGFFQKDLVKLCRLIKDKNRYRDILIYNYVYNVTFNEQFCALTLKLPTGEVVISYEGTDHNLSGWEEDAALCYSFPVPAQIDAIKYINKTISIFDKKVYVVGHSKGGHLAMVAAMYANPLIKFRIKGVYNFDGPGLRKKEIESAKYKKMEKKLIFIIPQYSVVGLLLRHGDYFISVKSSRRDIYSHSIFTWEINNDMFVEVSLSILSKNLDKSIIIWLEGHNDYEREKIIKNIFEYLRKSGINNVTEMGKIKNVFSLIKNSKELDKETICVIANFVKFNLEYAISNRKEG